MSGGEGPKMINQYFNVYALRRVRTAGYATAVHHEEYIYIYDQQQSVSEQASPHMHVSTSL